MLSRMSSISAASTDNSQSMRSLSSDVASSTRRASSPSAQLSPGVALSGGADVVLHGLQHDDGEQTSRYAAALERLVREPAGAAATLAGGVGAAVALLDSELVDVQLNATNAAVQKGQNLLHMWDLPDFGDKDIENASAKALGFITTGLLSGVFAFA